MNLMSTTPMIPGRVNFRSSKLFPHRFIQLEMHPVLAGMPTPGGKRIKALYPYNGVMLIGYGDWTANTGPTHIIGYDMETLEPVTLFENVPTEAFDRFVEIDGHIYAPYTDPMGGNIAGFTTNRSGEWENVTLGTKTQIHTFDVIKINGRLHICGSYSYQSEGSGLGQGCVYQEQPNGTWLKVLQAGTPHAFARFYKFFPYPDGRVRVQAATWDSPSASYIVDTFSTYDGTNWVSEPEFQNMLPGNNSTDPTQPAPAGIIHPNGMPGATARIVHEGKYWYGAVTGEVFIMEGEV